MNTSKTIKHIRSLSDLTQSDFANAIGVAQSRISEWESGKQSIRLNTISDICEKLNINFEIKISKGMESKSKN